MSDFSQTYAQSRRAVPRSAIEDLITELARLRWKFPEDRYGYPVYTGGEDARGLRMVLLDECIEYLRERPLHG